MKVLFDTLLTDLSGNSLERNAGEPVYLRSLCCEALMASLPNEQITGEEKLKRYDLAIKIHNGGSDLQSEEVALIKQIIGKGYSPLVVGQAWKILEGEK